jgi:hypothetical protein
MALALIISVHTAPAPPCRQITQKGVLVMPARGARMMGGSMVTEPNVRGVSIVMYLLSEIFRKSPSLDGRGQGRVHY